jgi:hypothetical protein
MEKRRIRDKHSGSETLKVRLAHLTGGLVKRMLERLARVMGMLLAALAKSNSSPDTNISSISSAGAAAADAWQMVGKTLTEACLRIRIGSDLSRACRSGSASVLMTPISLRR